MEKQCTKCQMIKDINDFYLVISSSDGHRTICKTCMNLASKQYRKTNAKKLKDYHKKYEEDNKTTLIEYRKHFYKKHNERDDVKEKIKEYQNQNVEKIKAYQKEYREKNKDKNKKYQKDYVRNNRERLNQYKSEYNKEKPHIKAWRTVLWSSIKRLGTIKEDTTIRLLEYSALELKNHIASLFTDGMSWDNYGEWHIDHIKGVKTFNPDTPLKIVNALSNLQPLWSTTREINGIVYIGNLNKQ